MTDKQAKSKGLDSAYRSVEAASSFVFHCMQAVLQHVVFMHAESVENMIDDWLSHTGFGKNFCADCIITGCGSMAIRLFYRPALAKHRDEAGFYVGEISFSGVRPGDGRIPAPVQ